jgi:hypothetical protein
MQTDQLIQYQNKHANGRIDLTQAPPPQFLMSDKIPSTTSTSYQEALVGNEESSVLSKVFFSKENVERLQKLMQYNVYKKSNGQYQIGYQNEDTLKIMMRGIYLQNSHQVTGSVPQQIEQLDNYLLEYAVPQLMVEVKSYLKYRHDASTLVVPLEHPKNMTKKGEAPLEWKKWF